MLTDNKNIGLNGFWGSLWNGFKQAIGLRYDSESIDNNTGGSIGRRLAGIFNRLVSAASLGLLGVTNDYTPTAQEMVVLNPIIDQLNKWSFNLVVDLDNAFKTNINITEQMALLNNAVRQLQLIRDYYTANSLTTISAQAQQYLANEIDVMVKTFEATIEDLLNGNGIDFLKTEGQLVKNSVDFYPNRIAIPSGFMGYGVQYEVPKNEVAPIETSVPTIATNQTATISIAEPTAVTTTIAGSGTTNKTKTVSIVLVLAAIGVAIFWPNNKK
jgi:hypothetical protein